MISFLIFLLLLSILIVIHEFGHLIAAKRSGVKVERFSLGFGPKLLNKKIKDTEYSICAIPLGGYVKLAGDNLEEFKNKSFEYLAQSPGRRAQIIVYGPLLNYIMAFFCFWMIFFLGYPTLTSRIGETIDGFGAGQAGLMPQDKVVEIDGVKVQYWEELQKLVYQKKEGEVISLSVLRDDQIENFSIEIKEKESVDILGRTKNIGLIGIMPSGEIVKVRYGLFKALILGGGKLFDFTRLTYTAILRMITGKLSLKESVTGPLGIFYIAKKAAGLGFIAILHLVAVLNVSLAIFNLLPIPVLDGGHLLLLGVEKIKGGYLSPKTDRIINQLGLTFIVFLAAFIFYNDLIRFGVLDKITHFLKR